MVSIHHNKQNKGCKIKIFVLVPSDVTDTADDESQLSEENSVSQRLIQLQKRLEIEQKVGQIQLLFVEYYDLIASPYLGYTSLMIVPL